jgi:hypothetical protein
MKVRDLVFNLLKYDGNLEVIIRQKNQFSAEVISVGEQKPYLSKITDSCEGEHSGFVFIVAD